VGDIKHGFFCIHVMKNWHIKDAQNWAKFLFVLIGFAFFKITVPKYVLTPNIDDI
jgi:hypothetical protein